MSYSQQPLITLLKEGKIEGETGVPKHIETVISNVFVFENTAYKIYKNNSEFFNKNFYDISGEENRSQFAGDDFNWNHTLSPEVYTELKGISVQDKEVVLHTELLQGREPVIVMRRLDMDNGIFALLMKEMLSADDFFTIGYQFGEREHRLSEKETTQLNVYEDLENRVSDVKSWMTESGTMPSEDIEKTVNYLESFLRANQGVTYITNDMGSICIDFHSENGVFENGILLPIDTFSPKPAWRTGHRHINIYRIATDTFALSGEDAFRAILKGYVESMNEVLDPSFEQFFVIYAASIMAPYFYMLGKNDPLRQKAAEKYHTFLQKQLESTII